MRNRNQTIFYEFVFITCCLFAWCEIAQANAPGCLLDLKALDKIESAAQRIDFLIDLTSHAHSGVENELVAYYLNLPPSDASTNPNSDSYKVAVFKIVEPLLIGDEKERFVKQVFNDEIANRRELYDKGMVRYYPLALWREVIQVIEQEGRNWNMQDRLMAISADKTLSRTTRSLAYTCSMKLGFAVSEGVTTSDIQDILDSIPLQPEKAIPWEQYNDPQKRAAWCSENPVYIAERKRIADWRDAGNCVKYEGQLEFLRAQRLKPVELIVAMLKRDDLSRERKDALAELAASILAWLRMDSDEELALAKLVVPTLENYIDQMEDRGAFSKRYYAILSMRGYYEKMGIDGFPFKLGWAPTDPHFKFLNRSARELATNLIFASISPVDTTNILQIQEEPALRKGVDRMIINKKYFSYYFLVVVMFLLGIVLVLILTKSRREE